MTPSDPPSRPALRRASDATVHPALAGRSTGFSGAGAKPAAKPAAGPAAAKPPASKAVPAEPERPVRPNGKPLGKAKRSPTSDALRPTKKDPAVTLKVTVPKSLRKKLRARSRELGADPERVAAQLIADGLA